jgi:amidohydrolase
MNNLSDFEAISEYCVSIRRYLHQHPELSFHENQTAEFIITELKKLGIDSRSIAETGVYAVLDSGLPGPTVVIRADIDALPLPEENGPSYASLVPGVMHACGHDGHTAMLLGLGKVLTENPGIIRGKIGLLFQPAEECPPGGAINVIASGILRDVDYILGSHLTNRLPLGKIGIRPGSLMAAIDCFTVEIIGKGGHGSSPHQCIDPIVTGAHLVTAWQTLVSRRTDPLQPLVLTAGTFHSGTNFNIIPASATITGSIRCLSEQIRTEIEQEFWQITDTVCRSFGATARITYTHGYPVLYCEANLVQKIHHSVATSFGEDHITEMPVVMLSEDFAYYGKLAPSAYFFIGARNEAKGFIYENHHPQFDFDEAAMVTGVKTYLTILKNLGDSR